MMVVCKDRLDRIETNERMGVEAAAAVESDITALLSGKTYDDLVELQRGVQQKLTSLEPVDTDYWEGLLKKLLVWKAKVCDHLLNVVRILLLNALLKAKLKNLHEVVVRNRLEQLRKRQRDEALQAQEELLAGVARTASRRTAQHVTAETELVEEAIPAEEMEMYDRAMTPPLIDITKLSTDEREIDIVLDVDDRQALVSEKQSYSFSCSQHYLCSSNSVTLWLPLDSFRKFHSPRRSRFSTKKLPAVPTWPPKLFTGQKLKKIWMKKKNYSTLKKTSPIQRVIIGKISIGRVNQDISTVSTLVMNGTSIIKRIMSK